MPQVKLTFPKVEVILNVPADFVSYVTSEDLTEMALAALSVDHIGCGVDTICKVRANEKSPEWTSTMVRVDEDDVPTFAIEDDGFTALEKEFKECGTAMLTLEVKVSKPGEDAFSFCIQGPDSPENAEKRFTWIMQKLERIWNESDQSHDSNPDKPET